MLCPFFRANFFSEAKNLQENKTKDIEVTAIGKARISFLPKCEERVCCSTLLKRRSELTGGER